ncbi:MAG TPA: hypothetical protein DD435_09460 [Cyanobacteria bacterium UBA8530]|nr:hypothetical protein [Cyanobacteria bacterium UBA8530]
MPSSLELGVKAFQEKRYEEAVTIFEAMAGARAEDIPARLMLAKAYQFNHQTNEARRVYQSILAETEAPNFLKLAQDGLNALPEEVQEVVEAPEEAEETKPLFCPRCDELIPEERRDAPWCACGWNKPLLRQRLLLTDLQRYAEKISLILAIKRNTDLFTLDGNEMRIMHLSDQSSPVDPRLVLKVERGLAFISPEELSLVMPQVHETAVFRERKQKNDLSLGKLFTWEEMVAKMASALGYDATSRPMLFTLDEVFAMYRVLPQEMIDQAIEEAVNSTITVGQAFLELGMCSLREILVGSIGGPRLFLPANHTANQIGHYLLEKGKVSPEKLREALVSQAKKLKPLGNLLVEAGSVSSDDLRAAIKELKEVRIHLAETERIGELLIRRRTITRTELIQALEEQKKKKKPLGKLLLELGCIKNDDDLVDALHWQELKIQTRRQGKIRLGELLIEKEVIGRKELANALVRQMDHPLPLGELLVQAGACTPEQLIEGILLQEERLNSHVEALIQKEIKDRQEGRGEEKRRKAARSEREKAKREKERADAHELENSERRQKVLKGLFGKKKLFLALAIVFIAFFSAKQLFFKPEVESAAPSSSPSVSSAPRSNPRLGQHPTYDVDIDAVISGIEKGKDNPLEVAMKPATGTLSVGEALRRTGASSRTVLPLVSPNDVVPSMTIGDPTLSSAALNQEMAKNSLLLQERPEDPKPLIKMGDALNRQGKPEQAIKSYQEALARDPNSATAYQQMGMTLESQGKLPEAKAELEKASQLAPLNPAVQRDYGNLLEGMGQHEKAVEVYQQAIAADPNDHRTYTRMGIALRSKQDSAGALLCFNQAQEIEPEDPYSSYQLAVTLEGSGKNEEARKEYGRASLLLDQTAEKSLRAGISSAKKGNYQGLIFHFGESVRSKGLQANAQINVGKLLLLKKDFKGSVAYFNRAKGIYRRNAALHQGMGEAYLALKDKERASSEFTAANKIDPKLAKPYYYLGVACQEEKKVPLALELFDRFLALAPEGPLTKNARERQEILRAKK